MQRSFLKWAGGKASALSSIFEHLPQEGKCLVEPFMGSCTVALNTDYDKYILNDYNQDLVYLCAWVAKRPKEVIEHARPLFVPENNVEARYYELRAQYNQSRDPKERALLFLYINRHVYNALMRYNQSGEHNAPFGKYKKPRFPEEEMLDFSRKLKGKHVRFVCGGFESLRFQRNQDVVVYSDPPYLPASKTASFSSYTALGFKKEQHLLLNKKSHEWAQKAKSVWVSNHSVPLIKTCYAHSQEQFDFMVPRTISRNGGSRKPVMEALLKY